jgi:ABC-type lipoprotein export system ATPase subunit
MAPRPDRSAHFNTPLSEPDGCPGDPLIQMMEIVKTFKTPSGEFTALKGITACFYRGEFVSVVGKSGSGKSTLVNMITGIDHPTSGRVRIGDTYVHTLDENKMSIWRGRNLGIVFQFFQLLPMLSLLENVVLPMDFCNMFAPEAREPRAMELLEMVGLQDFAHQLPGAVAGGQQQSAAIARALANDPPILIADEPTGNLDSRTAETVFGLISRLVEAGKTVIMVTHDASLASRTNRSMILSDGELVNEWVAKAFPTLPHPRLLWLSHQLQPLSFMPGQAVGLQTRTQAGLYLVTNGQLEISLNHGRRADAAPIRLGPGDYLSELELRTTGDLLAGMRAGAGQPLEVLALDSGGFERWMQEASPDQNRLKLAAEQRRQAWEVSYGPDDRGPDDRGGRS